MKNEIEMEILEYIKSVTESESIEVSNKIYLIKTATDLLNKEQEKAKLLNELSYFAQELKKLIEKSDDDRHLILNILKWQKTTYELAANNTNNTETKSVDNFDVPNKDIKNEDDTFANALRNGGISGFIQRSSKY